MRLPKLSHELKIQSVAGLLFRTSFGIGSVVLRGGVLADVTRLFNGTDDGLDPVLSPIRVGDGQVSEIVEEKQAKPLRT